jgi:hypothetical protein
VSGLLRRTDGAPATWRREDGFVDAFGDGVASVGVGAGKNEDKFPAAVAAREIALAADLALDGTAYGAQAGIFSGVAIMVVEAFEPA